MVTVLKSQKKMIKILLMVLNSPIRKVKPLRTEIKSKKQGDSLADTKAARNNNNFLLYVINKEQYE